MRLVGYVDLLTPVARRTLRLLAHILASIAAEVELRLFSLEHPKLHVGDPVHGGHISLAARRVEILHDSFLFTVPI